MQVVIEAKKENKAEKWTETMGKRGEAFYLSSFSRVRYSTDFREFFLRYKCLNG